MGSYETEHLNRWIMTQFASDQADEAMELRAQIIRLVSDHPDLIEKGRSWPELRSLVERNA
jgi:hypothetical protein